LNYERAGILNKNPGDSQGVWLKVGETLIGGEMDLKKQKTKKSVEKAASSLLIICLI
jgi:hypothetical protein